MKKLRLITTALIIALSFSYCSSEPNGDNNSVDQHTSGKEGAIDSSRLISSDSATPIAPDTK